MQSIVVGTRPAESVRVAMQAPVTVHGRVEFSGASERPAAERFRNSFMVTIWQAQSLFRSPGPSSGSFIDAATGRITVKGVSPPGRYFAGPPSLPAPWVLESVTLAGRDVTDAAFTVGDADITELVITYTDRPASLGGNVSANVAEATVFIFPANRARWTDARLGTRTARVARPSSGGAYAFSNMPPGDYLIAAVRDEDAGDWPDAQFLGRLAAVASAVKILPNQPASLSLKLSALK